MLLPKVLVNYFETNSVTICVYIPFNKQWLFNEFTIWGKNLSNSKKLEQIFFQKFIHYPVQYVAFKAQTSIFPLWGFIKWREIKIYFRNSLFQSFFFNTRYIKTGHNYYYYTVRNVYSAISVCSCVWFIVL